MREAPDPFATRPDRNNEGGPTCRRSRLDTEKGYRRGIGRYIFGLKLKFGPKSGRAKGRDLFGPPRGKSTLIISRAREARVKAVTHTHRCACLYECASAFWKRSAIAFEERQTRVGARARAVYADQNVNIAARTGRARSFERRDSQSHFELSVLLSRCSVNARTIVYVG